MELIERTHFLNSLQLHLENSQSKEGHCLFVTGEAGIGKTSLIKRFCIEQEANCKIYTGTCDALFSPRPLAPLYDILWQIDGSLKLKSESIEDRNEMFSTFLNALTQKSKNTIIIFEDIHWADEATLDFIKFFARRITQFHCLFILTYRDDEVLLHHPLRTLMGQLPANSFGRMPLTHLSQTAVTQMASEKRIQRGRRL